MGGLILCNDIVQLLIDQVTEVQIEQPDLELVLKYTGDMIVTGMVGFCIDHDGRTYRDTYQVAISIPADYPDTVPTVKETAQAIPVDFHHFPKTGDLCLATPVELLRVFAQDRSLSHFINRLLIPYLFSYTYYREQGQLPYGELSHGLLGLLEYYQEFFGVGPITVMKFMKFLADGHYPPLMPCLCASSRDLRNCHGPKLDELRSLLPAKHFEADLRDMIAAAQAANLRLPERDIMPKHMWHNRQKRLRKAATRCKRTTRR